VSAAVIVAAVGRGFPVVNTDAVIVPDNSVAGCWFGSAEGMNSCTVPLTCT
jgi:hypothetical protein